MYGIVNKAIEDLVTENFGADKWMRVKKRSEVDIDFFISNEPYDDDITYKLATAASAELNIPLGDVFHAFGEWWVLRTGKEKYGTLMEAGGKNLKQFLINLPVFHNRVMLIYPKLTPPEFKISEVEESSLCLHYISKRQGLQDFVKGLISGLAKMYNTSVTIEVRASHESGHDHEIFKISWT